MVESEAAGSRRENDRADEGQVSEGQVSEGQVSEGQVSEGQVSEVGAMPPEAADAPITPGDATAGYPFEDAESGRPDEGTAGPNAAPRHGRTEPSNESSR